MTTPPITPPTKSNSVATTTRHRRFHLILDFDETITNDDTTWLIVEGARELISRTPEEKWRHCDLWATCLRKYVEESESHMNITALKENRKEIDDELWYQRSLRIIEEGSVTRVGKAGILKGVAPQSWRGLGYYDCQNQRVKITAGFRALVEKVQFQGGRWGVVSVNWSQEFLRGVLSCALGSQVIADGVPILSNRVVPETGYIVGPKFGPSPSLSLEMRTHSVCKSQAGVKAWSYRQLQDLNIHKLLLTSDDKLEAMRSLSRAFKDARSPQPRSFLKVMTRQFRKPRDENTPLVMYVGDSMTDIECLLEADIGVVMSFMGTGKVMETLGRLNISVLHVAFWAPQQGKSIWFARDFNDIINSKLFEEMVPTRNLTSREKVERWLNQSQDLMGCEGTN